MVETRLSRIIDKGTIIYVDMMKSKVHDPQESMDNVDSEFESAFATMVKTTPF